MKNIFDGMKTLSSPPTPNRAQRREGTHIRFGQFRDIVNGQKRMWEWRPTQEHPAKKRNRNRRRNKAARATRRAHR